jgi:dihydroxyacid dehydratase/phosphogluconate dehydratase
MVKIAKADRTTQETTNTMIRFNATSEAAGMSLPHNAISRNTTRQRTKEQINRAAFTANSMMKYNTEYSPM